MFFKGIDGFFTPPASSAFSETGPSKPQPDSKEERALKTDLISIQ
jgi:hypothetical protein